MAKSGRRSRRRKRHAKPRPRPEYTGKVSITRQGYGFCNTAEGEWFISRWNLKGAMDGDTVVVRPTQRDGGVRRAARVVRVLERRTSHMLGRYAQEDGFGVVIPLDPRIQFDLFIAADNSHADEGGLDSDADGAKSGACIEEAGGGKAAGSENTGFGDAAGEGLAEELPVREAVHPTPGDIVDARILVYPSRHETALGQVTRIIGREGDSDIDELVCMAAHDLRMEFSPSAEAQAEGCVLDVESALLEPDRVDLRDEFLFTIDPPDARDFDDAVSACENGDGGFCLGVHIADVSHYVPWGCPIDLDARARATSAYLADRVVPMLPERLSNGLCSLNPGEDRLAFSAVLTIDKAGEVTDAKFHPSVIKSRHRFAYDEVDRFMEGEGMWPSQEVEKAIRALDRLAEIRRDRRRRRGGIDFDGVELKVRLDEDGSPSELVLKHRTRATSLIEEAMICANEAVASYLESNGMPCVFRVHEPPAADSLSELVPLLSELGYDTDGVAQGQPHALQAVLERAGSRPEKELVRGRVLRAMRRAVYRPQNCGHFGLASDAYCHFTSPIRRYPDLIVHRLLRAALLGCFAKDGSVRLEILKEAQAASGDALQGLDDMMAHLKWLSEHSSMQERNAADAAWDSTWAKVLVYMERFVGKAFPAVITHCSTAGAVVMLENTVRGFLPIRELGEEYFDYDSRLDRLLGESSGKVWQAGKRVRVRLAEVDMQRRDLLFALNLPN